MQNEKEAATQADRNSAIRLLEAGGQDWQAKEIRLGQGDHFPVVQAFAAHRLASTTAQTEAVLEALERLERANEQLCAKRSAKTYDAMIHRDGCHAELIALDDARRAARDALAAHRESQP